MANDLPVFCRPVVIDSNNNSFSVDGAGKTITVGIYPNICAVAKKFQTESGVTVAFDSSFKMTLTSGSSFTISWTDTNLRDLFGFTATLSGSATYTATDTPQNCWVPTRSRADNDEWRRDARTDWRGVESRSGAVCGLRTGTTIYRTTVDFEALSSDLVLYGRGTATKYQLRSLEYFAEQSRISWSASTSPSIAGFYFFPDRDYATATYASASYTSGDAGSMELSSGASHWVYCHFDDDWYPDANPTLPIRSDYHDVSVKIHTATAPTWTGA